MFTLELSLINMDSGKQPIEVTGESWEANPPDQDGVKDNTMLMRLHEPGVLHNIKVRFMRDEVYVSTCNDI